MRAGRALLPLLAAGGLLACGGDPEKGKVEDVVDAYLEAIVTGDGKAACAQLDPSQRQAAASLGGSCSETVRRAARDLPEGVRNQVNEAEITVELEGEDRASADVGGSILVTLKRTGGRWLITQGVLPSTG